MCSCHRQMVITALLVPLVWLAVKLWGELISADARGPEPTAISRHMHRCYKGHVWRHSGAVAEECHHLFSDTGHALGACPFCTRYDALMIRHSHEHYCHDCKARWRHDGGCTSDRSATCPWCTPRPRLDWQRSSANSGSVSSTSDLVIANVLRGPHKHECRCRTLWDHEAHCDRPRPAALESCTTCREKRLVAYQRYDAEEYRRISRHYM